MPEMVTIETTRDVALMMSGWINAHPPQNDWEPTFVGVFLHRLAAAIKTGHDDDD